MGEEEDGRGQKEKSRKGREQEGRGGAAPYANFLDPPLRAGRVGLILLALGHF